VKHNAMKPIDADDPLAQALLEVVRETLQELRRPTERGMRIALDSSLDRDLGLDSLARVELLVRIERTFNVILPQDTLGSAETPRDLLVALHSATAKASPAEQTVRRVVPERTIDDEEAEPLDAATLLETLDWHLREHADRTQIIYLSDVAEEEISYAKLKAGAAAVAAGLQRLGLEAGQTVAIMLPTSPEYFYTYFGILLAGGIAVPIYPPTRMSQIEEHVRRHAGILANAQAAILVTVAEAMAVARLLEALVPRLRKVVTADELTKVRSEAVSVSVSADDIAFIQYTSGSTGNPKGVVLTHANLLANIRAIGEAIQVTSRDVFVSWLPLYHDMGLISGWLASLYFGNPLVVMSPISFLARPERWLWAIHRYGGTLTAAPNFAYELCLKRLDDEQLSGLNLASIRLMANGSESVSPDTIERFTARFSKYGFSPQAMAPVYGLAESTVGLLVPPMGRGALIDRIRREPFVRDRKAIPATPDDPNPQRYVACGRPLPKHEIRIVDETGLEVGERVEGQLEFKGPSATSGYYRNPEQTKHLFHGEWLDTGDRAYIAQGDVYITGRVKDIIIRGGRNIYPHELEETVGALDGVRKGCVAVFGSPDKQSGTERLVVLAETRETDAQARDALHETISRTVVDVLGEPPDEVVLAPPHTVLKTSSGKLRRSASRELYEAGLVGARSRATWWQVTRLFLLAALPQARRWLAISSEILYAVYTWVLFWLIAPLTWLITAVTPRPSWAWAVGRAGSRLFLKASGTTLIVRGMENLPRDTPNVLVANHASYLDGVILVAALPRHYSFVAKRELRDQFISRIYLERLGAEFVERFAVQQSVEDTTRMVSVAAGGRSLAFFPEGTFTRAPGLLPFHLGAFAVAARAGAPVVPVAVRGSRALLRADQWFPRRGMLVVTIGMPISPPSDTRDVFAAAVRLRDLARAEILHHCGEPDAVPQASEASLDHQQSAG
jgi:1-acyl-sn-glycerol-3-phosphate acyltransferase